MLSDYNADLGKKTMIVEANYPRLPGAYSPAMPDFASSDAGQAHSFRLDGGPFVVQASVRHFQP